MGDKLYVVVLQRRPHAADVGVGLPVGEARKPVEAVTANAPARLGIGFVEVDPHRQMEGMVTGPREVVGQLLDSRLV